jgi:hypothetical protein
LLVRDLELIEEAEVVPEEIDEPLPQVPFASLLDDLAHQSEASSLPQAEMPDWVRKLAPPEIETELPGTEPDADIAPEGRGDTVPQAETHPDTMDMALDSDYSDGSDEDIISLLEQAMDSGEDVELEPEMFAKLTPAGQTVPKPEVTGQPYEVPPTAGPPAVQPRPHAQQADPLLILFMITFVVIVVTALVIVVIMLLR